MRQNIAIACTLAVAVRGLELQAGIMGTAMDGSCCCQAMPCMPSCADPCPDLIPEQTLSDPLEVDVVETLADATEELVEEILDPVEQALDDVLPADDVEVLINDVIEPVVNAEADHLVVDPVDLDDLVDGDALPEGETVKLVDPLPETEDVADVVADEMVPEVNAQTDLVVEVVEPTGDIEVDPECIECEVVVENEFGFPEFGICVIDKDKDMAKTDDATDLEEFDFFDYDLKSDEFEAFMESGEIDGSVILVAIGEDGCGPCDEALPDLEDLYFEFPLTTFIKVTVLEDD